LIIFILEEFEEVKKSIKLIGEKKNQLKPGVIKDCIKLLEVCLEIFKGEFI
jgi:hypothetical protein